MKAWLKGLIIGAIIGLILSFIYLDWRRCPVYDGGTIYSNTGFCMIKGLFVVPAFFPLFFIYTRFFEWNGNSTLLFFISVFQWSIIGLAIGWIVSRFKKKSSKK